MRALLFLTLVTCGCAPTSAALRDVPRGRDFWLGLRDAKFQVPAGTPRAEVWRDAAVLVDAADPVLRDDVGYGLAVHWVYRDASATADEVKEWTDRLLARLTRWPDARADSVLGRSFAALSLSLVAAAELKQQRLERATFDALVEAGARALELEDDLRGHDARLGWVHATAHTADLLKFLARDPRLTPAQQTRMLSAVAARLERPAPLSWGEDERLAAVLRSLALRPDAGHAALTTWAASVGTRWQALWGAPRFDPEAFQRLNAARQVLRALVVSLPEGGSEGVTQLRAAALASLT